MTELHFKIISAICASCGVLFAAFKIWQGYKNRVDGELRNHGEEILVQKSELAAQREEIDDMKVNFQKSFDSLSDDITRVGEGVNTRMDKVEDKNREDHRLLFETINLIGNAVSETNGYLRAKNEKSV